jgi:hypothetical protein
MGFQKINIRDRYKKVVFLFGLSLILSHMNKPRLLNTFKHFNFTLRKDSFQNPSEPFFEGKFQDFFEQIPKILYIVFRLLSQKKKKNLSKSKKARA